MSIIDASFQAGQNFNCGAFCVIEPDVIVGDNVKLGHHVVLKSGTRFGSDIDFADYCCTTGLCYVGNGVNVRTRSTISKAVIVEDKAFIGAGVMTSHTKNIYSHRPDMPKRQLVTRVGYGAVIGSHTNIMAGIRIGPNIVVGYGSNVVKDLTDLGIYVGNPARMITELPTEMLIHVPREYEENPMFFTQEALDMYLPFVKEQ